MTFRGAALLALSFVAACGDDEHGRPAVDAGCADADVASDPANCGGCGQECSYEETCMQGVCTCSGHECPDGFGCCAGSCHSLADDEAHCGRCDNSCPDGVECAAGACGGG